LNTVFAAIAKRMIPKLIFREGIFLRNGIISNKLNQPNTIRSTSIEIDNITMRPRNYFSNIIWDGFVKPIKNANEPPYAGNIIRTLK